MIIHRKFWVLLHCQFGYLSLLFVARPEKSMETVQPKINRTLAKSRKMTAGCSMDCWWGNDGRSEKPHLRQVLCSPLNSFSGTTTPRPPANSDLLRHGKHGQSVAPELSWPNEIVINTQHT
jgi:hypothetical protein